MKRKELLMNEILAFTFISALLVISPGPNGVLIVKTVSLYGKKFAFINIIGLVLATFMHASLSVFGLSALVLQSSELFFLLKILGASYLLYVGLKSIYFSFKKEINEEKKLQNKKQKDMTFFKAFNEGFLTQMLNPKVSMFYLAAFPQFLDFETSAYFSAFILVCIHASINALWFLSISIFLSKMANITKKSKTSLMIQRISGIIFVYFAGLLFTQERV